MKFVVALLCSLVALSADAAESNQVRLNATRDFVQRVRCPSFGPGVTTCEFGRPIRDVRIVRQNSNAPCIGGRTWGWDYRAVWVSRGCDALFDVLLASGDAPPPPPPGGPGDGWSDSIECASSNGNYHTCLARDWIRDIRLHRQLSTHQCVFGRTFGFDGRKVWVDQGCHGVFVVTY